MTVVVQRPDNNQATRQVCSALIAEIAPSLLLGAWCAGPTDPSPRSEGPLSRPHAHRALGLAEPLSGSWLSRSTTNTLSVRAHTERDEACSPPNLKPTFADDRWIWWTLPLGPTSPLRLATLGSCEGTRPATRGLLSQPLSGPTHCRRCIDMFSQYSKMRDLRSPPPAPPPPSPLPLSRWLHPRRIHSPSFMTGGSTWRLVLFPTGNVAECFRDGWEAAVSVYLEVPNLRAQPDGWERKHKLSLIVRFPCCLPCDAAQPLSGRNPSLLTPCRPAAGAQPGGSLAQRREAAPCHLERGRAFKKRSKAEAVREHTIAWDQPIALSCVRPPLLRENAIARGRHSRLWLPRLHSPCSPDRA